jgi:hypothetical protein
MTALPFEADEALEEGVKVHWLRTFASIETNKRCRKVPRVVRCTSGSQCTSPEAGR